MIDCGESDVVWDLERELFVSAELTANSNLKQSQKASGKLPNIKLPYMSLF